MRVIKGLFLFSFLSVMISACFDAPEFSNTPEISFDRIKFKEVPGANTIDTLILYFNFRDGDGDIGLRDEQKSSPYNGFFYYLADGLGDTTEVGTRRISVIDGENEIFFDLLDTDGFTPDQLNDKIVTSRTRSEPNYGYLPVYDPNSQCLNYIKNFLVVPASVADATYDIEDTLYSNSGGMFFLLEEEPLLYRVNPNYYNIEVRFWVFDNGTYVEYDWREEFCIDYNGRIPVLSDGDKPLEGTVRYAMESTAFLATFSINQIRLSFRIRDRDLRTSNEVFTPTFTLDGIR